MKIYSLADGMKEISVSQNDEKNNLEVGTIIQLNGYSNPKYVIVKNLGVSDGFKGYGAIYECINLNDYSVIREEAYSLKFIEEKKDDRIQYYITREKLGAVEAVSLWANVEAKKQADIKAKEEKARAKELEAVKLRKDYPFLVETSAGVSSVVTAAKNIRTELKRVFPGVKFSVRSKSYSMGNSINIDWIDGPTVERVESVTQKYQYGDFDGMEDIYNSRCAQFNDIFGGSKYVFENREYSEEIKRKVFLEFVEQTGQENAGIDAYAYTYEGRMDNGWSATLRLLSNRSL